MNLLEIAEWLETTRVAELVTQSQYGFPILVAIHLMGLGFSAGAILWTDLRLLGWALPSVPVREVYRRLAPIMIAGFVTMLLSGAILLIGYATAAYENTFFRIKLVALGVAGLNAFLYHRFTEHRVETWPAAARLPVAARAAGLVSMSAWLIVILCGRFMSYTMF